MESIIRADSNKAPILYVGRELTQAEALGFRPESCLGQKTSPLLIASWGGLFIVITTTIGACATLVFGSALISLVDWMRRE